MLQWGRGGEAAESPAGLWLFLTTASFKGAAAVRPRKAARDELGVRHEMMLQWGRGGEAAESTRGFRVPFLDPLLQWGRGGEAAERGAATERSATLGEASMGPRR